MQGITDNDVYSAMQTGTPYRSYIKTILGQVYVTYLNPFTDKPEGRILKGNPRQHDRNSIIEIWNEKEDVFFKRLNTRHFDTGTIIEYKKPENVEESVSPNQITDDEIVELLGQKFLALQNKINKMTSIAPVYRILELAKEHEKSDKIIKFIETKLSALQAEEYEDYEDYDTGE